MYDNDSVEKYIYDGYITNINGKIIHCTQSCFKKVNSPFIFWDLIYDGNIFRLPLSYLLLHLIIHKNNFFIVNLFKYINHYTNAFAVKYCVRK